MAGKESGEKTSGTDRISNLPDSVRVKIASCLPTKNAVATSILSKRWKNVFASIAKLHLDESLALTRRGSAGSFKDFVNKLLFNRTSSLETLILNLTRLRFVDVRSNLDEASIISWVSAAVRLNVRFLDLYMNLQVDTSSLFTSIHGCTTLSSLELGGQFSLRLPDDFSLPNLKTLTLDIAIHYLDAQEIYKFIDGCHVLEALCIRRSIIKTVETNLLSIRSHHLKRFSMQECCCYNYIFLKLDAPNLRVLTYDKCRFAIHVVSDFKSLESAHIDCHRLCLCATGLAELIVACSSIVHLHLTADMIDALHRMSVDLPTFQNLTCLQLGRLHWEFGLEMFSRLLCSAPNLEKLVFEEGFWNRTVGTDFDSLFSTLPICLGLHIKEINFLEFDVDHHEFELIEWFLKNGKVMEKLKLHCSTICSSCSLDRLHRLSMNPIVFITFACWKDERLLNCICSNPL